MPLAGVLAAVVAVGVGVSAAIAAAATPKVNRADVIKVPNLFMGSPALVLTSATKYTPDQLDHVDAEEVRLRAQ